MNRIEILSMTRKKWIVFTSIFAGLGMLGYILFEAVFNARVAARRTQDK